MYELVALLILLTLYVWFARRNRLLPLNLIAASCVTVIGLHLMSLL